LLAYYFPNEIVISVFDLHLVGALISVGRYQERDPFTQGQIEFVRSVVTRQASGTLTKI
jgi:hypothetical protein